MRLVGWGTGQGASSGSKGFLMKFETEAACIKDENVLAAMNYALAFTIIHDGLRFNVKTVILPLILHLDCSLPSPLLGIPCILHPCRSLQTA
jgi:hypothetical protein